MKDSQSIASPFNKYFSNIGSKLGNEIPPVDTDPQIFLGLSLVNSFMLVPITSTEVEDVITSLQSAKASGPYSIPVCLLKLIKTCISFPVHLIYNLSFGSGYSVPDHFKLANAIPILKKDSVTCMNNYQPISCFLFSTKYWKNLCIIKRLVNFINK